MPTEVKQRKKSSVQSEQKKSSEEERSRENGKSADVKTETGNFNKSSFFDFKSLMCFVSLVACGALSWMVVQQNEKVLRIEEKFEHLHRKTSSMLAMEEEVLQVSKKCGSLQLTLEGLGSDDDTFQSRLKGLEQDVGGLKDWASELTGKRALLQTSMTTLTDAVDQIRGRTSVIAKDFANKVASVRTDVRRMDGLQSELESLLAHVGDLEDKASQMERSMVSRIGDLLAGSIDRVAALRAASERNTQAIEQLRRQIPELNAADQKISERLRELESGRARVIRTVTFASDLQPKVGTIRQGFAALEPQLSDLTLRIGTLAEDLTKTEQEITDLRQALNNLTSVEQDLSLTKEMLDSLETQQSV